MKKSSKSQKTLDISQKIGNDEEKYDRKGEPPNMNDFVTYEAFGAVGDGVTDDAAAIVAAHA